MTKILTITLAALALLSGVPLLAAALIVSTSTAAAHAATCTLTALPATGDWRPPYEQAYAVGNRGFGMRWHPILGRYRMHTGQDLTALPSPGPVVAASSGTITAAGYSGGLGNRVTIDHGHGISTLYGHLASITAGITPGTTVATGTPLGIEGSTGLSTGNHLHFEVHHNATPIDPIPFMLDRGAPLNGIAVPPTPQHHPAHRSTDHSDDTGTGEQGWVREGGIGFPLPPPGQPRRASLTNPPTTIPADIKDLYVAAAHWYKIPWTLLAGIGMAETAHGANTATSSAGAQGLMQFLPATFTMYGTDGDGDGTADIGNDADSIHSAANYLTASGVSAGHDGVRRALFAYNRADWYVNDVLHYAHAYGGGTILGDPTDCGPDGDGDPTRPPLTGEQVQTVLAWATSRTGDTYRLGATGPDAWDCSSFTQNAYARIGLTLPRTAAAQRNWLAAGHGQPIPPGQEQPGDLIFVDSYLGPNQIGHVMIVFNPATKTTIEAGGTAVGHYDYQHREDSNLYQVWRPAAPTS